MKKLLFMLVFNLSTAHTLAADEIGQKCAELAGESLAVCSEEKVEINKEPTTDEARSNYKACMKGFVQDCRIRFSTKS